MADTTAAFFTQKRNQYQQVVQAAEVAAGKAAAANQALDILSQTSITPEQVDTLFELHAQVA